MGEVYRAKDSKLDREVAIKVLPPGMADDPERLARFDREAKVLASLNHPNIAQIYGLEENALVMELVAGSTLTVPQPLATALLYAKQIAEALEAAHEKGIIHRDLKPANIMVTPDGVVKILDFGLASVPAHEEISDPANSPTLTMRATQAGLIMGTAAYMSPEQAAGKPVDKRSDIWSFGVVLYEMLSGVKLFDGETVSHTLAHVLTTPLDFDRLPASIPAPIVDLVKRCLDRNPKARLRDIGEARIAIEKYLANPVSGAPVAAGTGRRAAWVVAAVFGVVAAGLGVTMYPRWREAAPKLVSASILPPEKGTFGTVDIPVLSPDGRKLAFIATQDGNALLWVRDLQSLTSRSIAGTNGASDPFWSPDGQALGFFTGGALKRVDIAGGPVFKICDTPALTQGGSWSSRGVIVFAGSSNDGLSRVSASGGTPTPVTKLAVEKGERSHRFPWFLPDGRHFLYTVRISRGNGGIYVGDLDSNARVETVKSEGHGAYVESTGFLVFSTGGAGTGPLLAQRFDVSSFRTTGEAIPIVDSVDVATGVWAKHSFSVSQDGLLTFAAIRQTRDLQLTWFDRSGKLAGTIGAPSNNLEGPRISPDGTTVAYYMDGEIWLHDLARDISSRFTFSPKGTVSRFPAWLADSKTLAFRQDGSPVRKTIGSSEAAARLGWPDRIQMIVFSPDGRHAMGSLPSDSRATGYDIWHQSLNTPGEKPRPYLESPNNETDPRFAPSSDWVVYTGDETHRWEIYVQSFPDPGIKYQISINGGTNPVWSRDGKEIYFLSPDQQMMATSVKNMGAKLEFGIPKRLFDARMIPGANRPNYDVSKDGKFLVVSQGTGSISTISLMVNWQAALKK